MLEILAHEEARENTLLFKYSKTIQFSRKHPDMREFWFQFLQHYVSPSVILKPLEQKPKHIHPARMTALLRQVCVLSSTKEVLLLEGPLKSHQVEPKPSFNVYWQG